MNELLFYLTEGFKHVVDLRFNSYDHVLFFILMAIPYSFDHWKKVVYASFAFTLGHTLSILLATYNLVSVNPAYVEFSILATIFVTAVYNLLRAGKSPSTGINWVLLILTLFFGLIHGLGFASTFNMLASGVDSKFLLALEFALGIEMGQLLVIFIVLILGFLAVRLVRLARRDWNLVISSIILGLVLPLLFERFPF